ncbi:hypothetical protein ABNIH6_15731, partial [Acinetobacter baumannii ABNIH6]
MFDYDLINLILFVLTTVYTILGYYKKMIFKLIENNAEQRRGVRRRARTTDTTEELAEHCIYHLYFAYIQHVVMKTCGLAFS